MGLLPLHRLARTGFKESVVARVKVPKTPSGPSSRNTASRRDSANTMMASVSFITATFVLASPVTNCFPAMFDETGATNFTDIFDEYEEAYGELTVAAGARVEKNLVDTTARTGYGLIGVKPKTPQEMAVEYYTFDWEYAQTPEVLVHLHHCSLDSWLICSL